MYSKAARLRLGHIVENADRVAGYVAGLSFEAFSANSMVVDAVERCLSRVTEAAIRAGADVMAQAAPDVPLHILRGFGNALRHDYDKLDLPTIWRTARQDLPKLREACAQALGGA